MLRMLRVEGKKTLLSVTLWAIFAVMVFISFWFSGMNFSKLPDELSSAYGMQYALEEPMSRGEYVFLRTMSDASFTAWLSIIAGALIIGMDFSNRTINNLIYAGNKRINVLIVKLVYFYISTFLLSSVYPAVNCIKYSLKWFYELTQDDVIYVLRCIAYRAILDMAMMSFTLVSAFVFRDIVRTLGCSLIIIVVMSQLMGMVNGIENGSMIRDIVEYFPAYSIRKVMFREVSSEIVNRSMLYSTVMILITGLSCYILFRRADLQ